MNSTPIASDLSYEVFQLRARRFELTTPELDSRFRSLYGLPSQIVVREAFIGDRGAIPDSYQGGFTWDRPYVGKQR